MQLYTVASLLTLATVAFAQAETGKLGDAATISGNPTDVVYTAVFASNSSSIKGQVEFKAGPGAVGSEVVLHLQGFPIGKGDFSYHIHDQPVPTDGNCTGTKAHLDPYQRGQATPCAAGSPQTCEVGDLAGKYGKIPDNTTTIHMSYTDAYLSLKSPSGAFIGNRSIVIHAKDASRIACANITIKAAHDGHGSNDTVTSPTPGPSPNAGAAPSSAGRVGASAFLGFVVAGLGAFALL